MKLSHHKQRGMSLVEVMVALLIMTIGLLGFAGIQTRAVGATEYTYTRTQAVSLAQDMLERMRMNGVTVAVQSSAYSNAAITTYTTAANWTGSIPTQNCLGTSSTCSSSDMALYDIAQIRSVVQSDSYLPQGQMLVERDATSQQVFIYVAWGGTTTADCKTAGGNLTTCVLIQGT